jgi:UMF1 family MFS transporter
MTEELRAGRISMRDSHAPAGVNWGRAVSWAFYDFANTIYSALVVSFAITLHVKEFTGVEKYTFATVGLSLLASGLFLPFAGEIADRTGRAKRYLFVLTLGTCGACVALTFAASAWLILALFFIANFCYNSSLTFYDSMLPALAPRRRLGTISGLGVALGYVGVAFALPLGKLTVDAYARTDPAHELTPLFALAGILFLTFSLPLFLCVPAVPSSKKAPPGTRLVRLAYGRVLTTLRALPRHRPALLFLLGNFFMVDSLNTGIIAAAPYMVNVFGVARSDAMLYLIPFSLGAGILGALGGRLADSFGARRTMLAAGGCVMAAIVVGAVTTSFVLFIVVFVLLGGFGLANIWVAGRKLLIELVPPGQIGKYFGLYNVGHKLSMIGAVAFGLLADVRISSIPAGGYRLGLLSQTVLLAAGIACIWRVKVENGKA